MNFKFLNNLFSDTTVNFKYLINVECKKLSKCHISSYNTSFFKPDDINIHREKNYFDLVVVGGGIVGITTARAMLIEKPNLKVAILEKESDVAVHQTGHNSGVIHAGLYYRPESLKAKLCVAGLQATYKFCDKHNIPYKKCGKLIVATDRLEIPILNRLYEQGIANKSPGIELINGDKIKQIEPHCQGVKAIYSPNTGIIDWGLFTKYCAIDFQKRGGLIFCNFKVDKIKEAAEGTEETDVLQQPLEFHDTKQGYVVRCKYGITCGGLYSDVLAEIAGGLKEPIIIPFRGEYLELTEEKRYLINGNIYPVPDPKFPFLGVHFTPRLDGSVWLGPNAVLALCKEGYSWKDFSFKEFYSMIKFSGFYNLMTKYGSYGRSEIFKSFFISSRIKDLQKYIPEISQKDVIFRGKTGVRAQAIDETGLLVNDLILQLGTEGVDGRILHVRNAPSPAATSSLALAEFIIKSALVEFEF